MEKRKPLEASPGSQDRAFELIYLDHSPMILAYLLSLTGHRAKAEDLTQETFLVAYRKMEDFDPSRSIAGWLRGIAHNLARNALRKDGLRSEILMGGDEQERVFSRFDRVRSDDPWEKRLSALDRCLGRLPARQGEVVHRYYQEAQPARSIAEALGILERTVFQLIWQARNNLRRCIETLGHVQAKPHGT